MASRCLLSRRKSSWKIVVWFVLTEPIWAPVGELVSIERPLVVFVWSGRMDVICVVFALAVVHGSECYCPGIWECCSWNQRVNHQHHLDEPLACNVLRVVLLTASVCVQACQMSQDVPCAAIHLVWKIVLRCVGSLFLRFVSKLIGARLFHGRSRAVCPFVRVLRTQTC